MWEVFEHVISLKRLTITDVSKATGINQSTFSEWKRRGNDINPKAGKLIARFLGIPLEYLYTGEMPEGYYENDETAAIAQEIHDSALFVSTNGSMSPSAYKTRFRSEFPNHTTHDCRHSFATYAYKSRMDATIVKLIMGHRVSDITRGLYTHLDADDLSEEMRKFRIS